MAALYYVDLFTQHGVGLRFPVGNSRKRTRTVQLIVVSQHPLTAAVGFKKANSK